MDQPVTPGEKDPDPGAEGATGVSAPAELLGLLRNAYVARRSGYLHITQGVERRGLSIREGHIVHGRSDVAGEHLGDVLVRHGLVTQDDLERAVEVVLAERRPLGSVLARLSLVEEARLEEAVGWHVREILFAALDRPACTVVFEDLGGGSADPGEAVSRISTGQVLLEAARRLKDPETVREALGDRDRKLVLAVDPRLRVHPVALTPTDGFVLSRIDGTLSAREIVDLLPLPPEEIERSLLGLLCTGAIAPRADARPLPRGAAAPPRVARAPDPPASPAGSPPVPWPGPPTSIMAPASPAAAAPSVPVPSPPVSSPEFGPLEVRRLIIDAYESLGTRDHFELLGVSPQASAGELRAAYALLARTLHPDACGDPALADLNEQRKVVFLRVCQAYETLRDPEARTTYERDFRRRRTGPKAPPLLVRSPLPASPEPPPPPPPVPEASAPARVPVPPRGPEPPPPSLEERLAETIALGEELLRDGHHWEAIRHIEPTLQQARGELRTRARLALARACLKNPLWLKRAETHLQDVVREDPERAEAHLLLGSVYRAGHFRARALAAYRKVLDLQPHNRQALRELARLEAEEPPPPRGSLLGFFKKR
jgi:tetratricopeptide (TPR) repeat protein